jgi:(2R)-3-sulfolactate dehydrogenase (NADP+)
MSADALSEARRRLEERGAPSRAARAVVAHLAEADDRGKHGHGLDRIGWICALERDFTGSPARLESSEGVERWSGSRTLGYVVLDEICRSVRTQPPKGARLFVLEDCFPTGALGLWARRIAVESGLVAVLTATSPPRLPHPEGGAPVTGTNPIAIAVPASDAEPVVTDVAMGAVTFGDVLTGRARQEELVPFGGPLAHKAFALAVGVEALVGALAGPRGYGAVVFVARPLHDVVPEIAARAAPRRLPGRDSA